MEFYDVDEFWKFDFCVGLVKRVEKLKCMRKFIKFDVDFGGEERMVIMGIVD